MKLDRFIYTSSGVLIDTVKVDSCSLTDNIIAEISYKSSRFAKEVVDPISLSAATVADVAVLVLEGKIPGHVMFTKGSVAKGAYPDALIKHCGPNAILSAIWLNTNADTMVRWWVRDKGVLRKILQTKRD